MEEEEHEPHQHQLHPLEQSQQAQQQQQYEQQHHQQQQNHQQEHNEDQPHIDRNNNDLRFDAAQLQVDSTRSPAPVDQSTVPAQPAAVDQSAEEDQQTATAQLTTTTQSTEADHSTASNQSTATDQSTATNQSTDADQSIVSAANAHPAETGEPSEIHLVTEASSSISDCESAGTVRRQGEETGVASTVHHGPAAAGGSERSEGKSERRAAAAAGGSERSEGKSERKAAQRDHAVPLEKKQRGEKNPSRQPAREGDKRQPETTFDVSMFARRRQLEGEEGEGEVSEDDCDRIVLKRSVPVVREEAELRARIHCHITSMLQGGWARAATRQLRIRRVIGGMSSELFYVRLSSRVQLDAGEPRRVLVRFFAQPSKTPCHPLVLEAIIFTIMSELHRGPRLYGCFDAGRVEEWIPAEPLGAAQLSHPAVSRLIARQLAVIHSMTTPLAKDPRWIWHSLEEWMKFFAQHSDMIDLDLLLRGANLRETFCIDALRGHLRWLKNIIEMRRPHVVFCHNDLHGGNILYRSEASNATVFTASSQAVVEEDMAIPGTSSESEEALIERVLKRRAVFPSRPERWCSPQLQCDEKSAPHPDSTKETCPGRTEGAGRAVVGRTEHGDERSPILFIDFEYSSYNYLCYDLANHFNEWMYEHDVRGLPSFGFDASQYPTRDQQRAFLLEYLAASSVPSDVISDVAEKHLNDMDVFSALSHFFWALWSLQRYFVTVRPHFDYLAYAVNRMVMFLEFRRRVSEAFRQAAVTSSHVQEEDSDEEEYEDEEDDDDDNDEDGGQFTGVS